jgi:hypothetical protein
MHPRFPRTVRVASLSFGLALIGLVGCGAPAPKVASSGGASEGNPLGPSYVLIPLPSEDDSILGRVLPAPPSPGRSLEETARANPCADKLSEAKISPSSSSFENAEEIHAEGKAKAMLGAFGFSGDMERATHFVYRLETSKRVGKQDTAEYAACCAQKGCGYGYVSALVYGEGEYATGEETRASASAEVLSVGSASGAARVKVLHKRKVKGWLAAVVTVTDPKKGEALGPLGVAQAAGITEAGVPETVKQLYEREKVDVKTASASTYTFTTTKDGTLKENEFVRRFRNVTGSDEIDEFDTRRTKGSFYTAGTLTALSAGLTLVSVFSAGNQKEGFYPVGYGAGAATLGFGIWFLVSAFQGDGSADDHYLSEHDAVLYANRYNRALLRRTITDVQKTQAALPKLHLEPMFGLGSVGLSGRF